MANGKQTTREASDVRRAEEHFRARISDGEYAPGEKLPSIRSAALEIGVHHLTVADAYKRLADEGIVTVRPNVGAFVAEAKRQAQFFVCMESSGKQGTHSMNVAQTIMMHFASAQKSAGLKLIPSGGGHWQSFLEWIGAGVRERTIAGLWLTDIGPAGVSEVCSALSGTSIPVVDLQPLSRSISEYSVGHDIRAMIRQGTRYLIEQNCRRVALIFHRIENAPEYEEAFLATCEALKVQCEVFTTPPLSTTLPRIEQYGGKAAEALMRREQRPDGLLIMDDFLGRGSLAALLRMGVRVPDDVQICTLARKEDSYPDVFGLPVAKIEVDDFEYGEAACSLMERVVAKQPVATPHLWIQPRLVLPEGGQAAASHVHGGREVAQTRSL